MASFVVPEPRPHSEAPLAAYSYRSGARKQFDGMTFDQAFEVWIANRTMTSPNGRFSSAQYISPRTEWDYRQYARALGKMFGDVPLAELHAGHLREYHQARAFCDGSKLKGKGWDRQAGPNRIRKEVSMLVRMMKAAGLWSDDLELTFEPLAIEESDKERPLTPEEQTRFLRVAASRHEWALILSYTVLALQTCCSTNELRALQLGDVDLHQGVLTVRPEGAKNSFRCRAIPIHTADVRWALERLKERALAMGASKPQHYLFPFMASKGHYDPMRPMTVSGLKKKWDEVRSAAGLKGLRPYDLRHTAITRMAEAGTPIATIMSFAGHVSLKMQQHYTCISMSAKRGAAEACWGGSSPLPPSMRT